MTRLRAAHVVAAIGDEAMGPSYSVPRLCRSLVDSGVEVRLHVLARGSARVASGVEVHQYAEWPGRFFQTLGVSPRMHRALVDEARHVELIHNHSLWMLPNVYPGLAVRGTSCALVTSPRGVLARWSRQRSYVRKKAMWWLGQRFTVERTTCFHATSEAECESVREMGFRAPVAIIPNGVDVPSDDVAASVKQAGRRRVVFFGRIHPVKGVDRLIEAWASLQSRFADWEVDIVGPSGDSYAVEMRRLAERLACTRVHFHDAVYGDEKWKALARAELFVLPSRTENFGMTVAEALAVGVPAIVTKNAPWEGLDRERCGWWIEDGVDSLRSAMVRALSMRPDELSAMGKLGRSWMIRDFSWHSIGQRMAKTYDWIIRGGTAPSWIRVG
jgi:glycosyltransferase involved in cell wall biosynthesis